MYIVYYTLRTSASDESRGEEGDDREGGEERGVADVGEDPDSHQQEREAIHHP